MRRSDMTPEQRGRERLIDWMIEWRNMTRGPMTEAEKQAQRESWARANMSTGDPRFD